MKISTNSDSPENLDIIPQTPTTPISPLDENNNNTSAAVSSTLSVAAGGGSPVAPLRTLPQMFGLFSMSFSYALVFASVSNIVIAKEVDRISSTSQTTFVAIIMAVSALAQIITPVVGAWSDVAKSREPFMKAGTFFVVVGTFALYFAGSVSSMVVLFVANLVISSGLSIVYSMITVILHDQVQESQTSLGSAVLATLGLLGAGAGYSLIAAGLSLNAVFLAYAVSSLFCFFTTTNFMYYPPDAPPPASACGSLELLESPPHHHHHQHSRHEKTGSDDITSFSDQNTHNDNGLHENKNHDEEMKNNAGEKQTLFDNKESSSSSSSGARAGGVSKVRRFLDIVLHALTVPSPMLYPDFFLACISRGLFNSGLATQNYMIFFFRDVAKVGSTSTSTSVALAPELIVSRLAVLSLLGGLLAAIPAGYFSDKYGKKILIYAAVVVCISTMMSFPFLTNLQQFDLISVLFGIGNVCFLSIDYSLGVSSLPRRMTSSGAKQPIDAARDLGVFALSATGGMLIGQLVLAGILERYSYIENGSTHYNKDGFMFAFATASLFFLLSAVAAGCIRGFR